MTQNNECYVAYYRVSTIKQGNSGLGLDAQRSQVKAFIKSSELIAEYTDVETGTGSKLKREELLKAIQHASTIRAKLVIAKLDRLARNVNFVTTLMESGVSFVACDMPEANKFTIHIFAALAEQEADLISQRTKSALTELKLRGVKLGTPENLTEEARNCGLQKRIRNAHENEKNLQAGALVCSLRKNGMTFNAIARELNKRNFKTRRGKFFSAVQTVRLFERYTC